MNTENEQRIVQELRRGTITLAVLSQLDNIQYGYSLIKILEEKGFSVGQDTLYPLLRRLEEQGLLDSTWQVNENRPRRYYVINAEGKRIRSILREEWENQKQALGRLLK